MRWEGGKGRRVMRWQGGKDRRVVRWHGGRFLVLFKGGECRMSPRFYLFVSEMLIKGTKGQPDVDKGSKGDGLKIFLHAHRNGKTLLRTSTSC